MAFSVLILTVLSSSCVHVDGPYSPPIAHVSTVAGAKGELGEPFGIAVHNSVVYVSDGELDRIWRLNDAGPVVFASGLNTPSAMAVDKNGDIIVADTGSHTIRSVSSAGEVKVIAGVPGQKGSADGDAAEATFNGPIGIAISPSGAIYVADTYNDRIRKIENGRVSTFAGSFRGAADGYGDTATFDTPSGIAFWQDRLLVADTGNGRIRVVEPDGLVWTLAGSGPDEVIDGPPATAVLFQPTAIAVDRAGTIFFSDANSVRRIDADPDLKVSTMSNVRRGLSDGLPHSARFNRPSGLAVDPAGDLLIADSENRLIRKFTAASVGHVITEGEITSLRDDPSQFRVAQPARWPYDPPDAARDIAGTLGEIRGEISDDGDRAWFHNGLDIAGDYGETAVFMRDEKALRPVAAENFGTLRELLRMPTLGYVHIRLGRNSDSKPFDDDRFLFDRDVSGKIIQVRVPRGVRFRAGEPIGTLNAMNHVHLIAGRSGYEMNAIDALDLPGLTDSKQPSIENVSLFSENWEEVEPAGKNARIKLTGKIRVTVRAYDQADGNADRRRLGLYRLGYHVFPAGSAERVQPSWTISFDRLPPADAVPLVYAKGSRSGATGGTIFNYIVTNSIEGEKTAEGFLDTEILNSGIYTLRVFAADYFGNTTTEDVTFEVIK